MQFNKIASKTALALSLIILFSCIACTKESKIVPEKPSFVLNIPTDTIKELVPLHLAYTLPGNNKYLWDFGNGTASTECNPTVSYPMHGTYTISLEVTNSQGVSSLYSHQIVILCRFYNQIHNGKLL